MTITGSQHQDLRIEFARPDWFEPVIVIVLVVVLVRVRALFLDHDP